MHVNMTIDNDYKKSNQSLNLNAVPKKSNQAFVSKMKYQVFYRLFTRQLALTRIS
jgi:hypothetical protein